MEKQVQVKVYNPQQVADALGVDRKLVYRQLKAGTIPNVRVGEKFCIPIVAFEEWLKCNPAKQS